MVPRPPKPTLFPYTTLFRSLGLLQHRRHEGIRERFPGRRQRNLSRIDRKSTRLNSSHTVSSYAGFRVKKKSGQATAVGCVPASLVREGGECGEERLERATES